MFGNRIEDEVVGMMGGPCQGLAAGPSTKAANGGWKSGGKSPALSGRHNCLRITSAAENPFSFKPELYF